MPREYMIAILIVAAALIALTALALLWVGKDIDRAWFVAPMTTDDIRRSERTIRRTVVIDSSEESLRGMLDVIGCPRSAETIAGWSNDEFDEVYAWARAEWLRLASSSRRQTVAAAPPACLYPSLRSSISKPKPGESTDA
jgi:hypothetical protein